ncbi:hypothetical protein [Sphingobium sp. DC-2]|uniref:hypothetical protein n=1 Tax=Sphingobium sp. DC-2 TaxID=1303256 RepID=UPI0012DD7573|nr:hypothetical protein [Sphingobium sp. DC-2]
MPEDQSLPLMIGEMRGQLRELVHQFNNLAQKFEDVAKAVDASSHLPQQIAENKARIAALDVRVSALETKESERRGGVKLAEWALRVVPLASLGAGFAVMAKVVGL